MAVGGRIDHGDECQRYREADQGRDSRRRRDDPIGTHRGIAGCVGVRSFARLDPVTSAEIDQLILTLTKKLGVTSVVVTHEMDSAFTIADRMVMLDKGRCLKIAAREDYERIRSWILAGRSDDDIALAMMLSVKIVRLVRREVEAEVRPS